MKMHRCFTPHSSFMDLEWTNQVWAAHNLTGSWKMTSHVQHQVYVYKKKT